LLQKDTAKIILVGKNFILQRQKHPCGIDQVNHRQGVLEGYPLGAQEFLGRCREESAGFHRRIVGDDHARTPGNPPNARYDASRWDLAPIRIHTIASPETQFKKLASSTDAQPRAQSIDPACAGVPGLPPTPRAVASCAGIRSHIARSVFGLPLSAMQ
jgi:hypothetical protein